MIYCPEVSLVTSWAFRWHICCNHFLFKTYYLSQIILSIKQSPVSLRHSLYYPCLLQCDHPPLPTLSRHWLRLQLRCCCVSVQAYAGRLNNGSSCDDVRVKASNAEGEGHAVQHIVAAQKYSWCSVFLVSGLPLLSVQVFPIFSIPGSLCLPVPVSVSAHCKETIYEQGQKPASWEESSYFGKCVSTHYSYLWLLFRVIIMLRVIISIHYWLSMMWLDLDIDSCKNSTCNLNLKRVELRTSILTV